MRNIHPLSSKRRVIIEGRKQLLWSRIQQEFERLEMTLDEQEMFVETAFGPTLEHWKFDEEPIELWPFSTRTSNTLKHIPDINTYRDLLGKTKCELRKMWRAPYNLAFKSIKEIEEEIERRGHSLKPEPGDGAG